VERAAARSGSVSSLRQDKSRKGGWKCRCTETFQRDPVGSTPTRQRSASQPEASLAGVVATSLLKRRQQVLKPRDGPDIIVMLKPSLPKRRGQHRRHRLYCNGKVSLVWPGSWTGAKAQDGSPGNLRDRAARLVVHSSGCKSRQRRGPATAVVISSGGEGDQTVESQDVIVSRRCESVMLYER
jgi:hypothetical protein